MISRARYFTVLVFLAFFATNHEAQWQSLTPKAREELLEKAKQWGLPQPHAESALLKIKVYKSEFIDYFALGFVEPGIPGRALVGFDYWDLTMKGLTAQEVPDPEAISLRDIVPAGSFDSDYGINFGLLTGIQLLRRGNEKLGLALIEKALRVDAGHPHSVFRSPRGEEPVLMLARSCLASALNDITKPKPDFPRIKQRIESLLADQPKLKSEATDWVIEALEANVAHKPASADSIEQVIDDFLLGNGRGGAMAVRREFSPAERALILKGFEAVPALLDQRHSKRFTNYLMQGFNNFPSYPMNAGQVIHAYLQRLANDEFGSNWLDSQKGHTATDEAVLAWWKEASALGEEAYVKERTVTFDATGEAKLSFELLLLARERYPTLLPGIYRVILKTSYPSWPVAEALMESNAVTKELKIELFLFAIATNSEAHRNTALKLLRGLNPALADAQLLQILQKAPNSAKKAYWTDQDCNLGRLVSASLKPDVWKAFHALLDRADLGMRMELIDHLDPPHDAPTEILASFYRVYDRFRDDRTVRDESMSPKFSGPGAGHSHPKIEMRDFLHEHWARWMKLELRAPERGASPIEWEEYRDKVGPAIKEHRAEQNLPPERR